MKALVAFFFVLSICAFAQNPKVPDTQPAGIDQCRAHLASWEADLGPWKKGLVPEIRLSTEELIARSRQAASCIEVLGQASSQAMEQRDRIPIKPKSTKVFDVLDADIRIEKLQLDEKHNAVLNVIFVEELLKRAREIISKHGLTQEFLSLREAGSHDGTAE